MCSKFLLKAKVLIRVREREELLLNVKDYWRWYSLLFVCFFTSLIVKLSCTTCYLLNPTLGPLLTPGKALGVRCSSGDRMASHLGKNISLVVKELKQE